MGTGIEKKQKEEASFAYKLGEEKGHGNDDDDDDDDDQLVGRSVFGRSPPFDLTKEASLL